MSRNELEWVTDRQATYDASPNIVKWQKQNMNQFKNKTKI